MEFEIPSKHGNVVCCECHNNFPQLYHSCLNPCSHLVSWVAHEAQAKVVKEVSKTVFAIKSQPEDSADC